MTEEKKSDVPESTEEKEFEEVPSRGIDTEEDTIEDLKKSLEEMNDKYVRLYADFENYKKLAARNREELLKYANEELMTDLLTVIDHLELALQHSAGNKTSSSLAEGVDLTLKELTSVLEKYGLNSIDALGKPFNPSFHHAMSQIESEDAEENAVVKEFRKGYTLKDRVLRASLVGVAKKNAKTEKSESGNDQNKTVSSEEK